VFSVCVWSKIYNWLVVSTVLQNQGYAHLNQFKGLIGSGRVLAFRLNVIWFISMWSIWRERNDKLYNNKEVHLENIVE
jgi:hypothetical protein